MELVFDIVWQDNFSDLQNNDTIAFVATLEATVRMKYYSNKKFKIKILKLISFRMVFFTAS